MQPDSPAFVPAAHRAAPAGLPTAGSTTTTTTTTVDSSRTSNRSGRHQIQHHYQQQPRDRAQAAAGAQGAQIVAQPVLYNPSSPSPPVGPRRPQTVPSNTAPGLLGGEGGHRRERRGVGGGGDGGARDKARSSRAELRAKEAAGGQAHEILRDIKGLQLSFAQTLEVNPPYASQVEAQRQNIRRLYLTVLYSHPETADAMIFENHWMQTTHRVIKWYRDQPALKSAAALAAQQPASAPAGANGRAGRHAQGASSAGLTADERALVKRFLAFLASEIANYQRVAVRIAVSASLSEVAGCLPALSNGAVTAVPEPTAADPAPTEDERQRRLGMFVKSLIFLGDLERYRDMYQPPSASSAQALPNAPLSVPRNGRTRNDSRPRQTVSANAGIEQAVDAQTRKFEKAKEYYEAARMIQPENGNPFNQLATIASVSRDRFGATYYFLRALAVRESFATARSNLQVTLKGQLEAFRPELEDEASDDATEQSFQKHANVLLAMLLLRSGYESTLAVSTLRAFGTLLPARALAGNTILRTLVSFLAVHWDARLTRPGPRTAEAKTKPKVDSELLSLETILPLMTTLFKTAAQDIVETLSQEQKATLVSDAPLLVDEDASDAQTSGSQLDRHSKHLGLVLRRSLPSLRVAFKWLRAHQDYLVRVHQRHAAVLSSAGQDAVDAPFIAHSHALFSAFTELANVLALAFPPSELCVLERPLEEDFELQAFGPLRKVFPVRPPASAVDARDGHPNEEHLMRVWDLHHDALLLVSMESSNILIENGRFALVGHDSASNKSPAQATELVAAPSTDSLDPSVTAAAAEDGASVEADDIEIVTGAPVAALSSSGIDDVAHFNITARTYDDQLNFAEMDLEDDPVDAAMRAALGESDENFDPDEEARLGMTMSMHGWGEVEEQILWPPASARKASVKAAPSTTFDAPPRHSGVTALDLLQQLGSPAVLSEAPPAQPSFAASSHFNGNAIPTGRHDSIWGSAALESHQPDRTRTASLVPGGWGALVDSGKGGPSTGFGLPMSDSWTRSAQGSPHSALGGLGNGGFSAASSFHGQPSQQPSHQQQQQQQQRQPSFEAYSQLSSGHSAFGQPSFTQAQRPSVPGLPSAPYGLPAGFVPPGMSHIQSPPVASPGVNGSSRSPWG